MEKSNIKSVISIEYGLSREQTDKVVNSIFSNLADYFARNKKVEIQKFGKFKPVSEKFSDDSKNVKIRFTPSKKLSNRINSNFEHLEKVKIKVDRSMSDFIDSIPDEIITGKKEEKKNEEHAVRNFPDATQRKLISEDLIKLHKEIVSDEKNKKDADINAGSEDNANNLWR